MMILGIKRARWPTYIFLELPRATNFAVVSACLSFEKERRGKMHQKLLLYSSLLLLLVFRSIIIYNNHHRLIENKALRINSVVAVVIASQSSTVCG